MMCDVRCAMRSLLSHLGLSARMTTNVRHALEVAVAESMSMHVWSDGREKDGAMEWYWVFRAEQYRVEKDHDYQNYNGIHVCT